MKTCLLLFVFFLNPLFSQSYKADFFIAKDLSEFELDELRQFSTDIEQDVYTVLTLEGSVSARNHIGGTAPKQVRAAIKRARGYLDG